MCLQNLGLRIPPRDKHPMRNYKQREIWRGSYPKKSKCQELDFKKTKSERGESQSCWRLIFCTRWVGPIAWTSEFLSLSGDNILKYCQEKNFNSFFCSKNFKMPALYLVLIALAVILLVSIIKSSVRPSNFPPGKI